ncbi:MAG: hypothetical protein ACRD8O_02605 [Bryobacteraceae bacterium]
MDSPKGFGPLGTRERFWLGACLVFYLLLAGANSWTKAPWSDEAMFANPSIDLITRGSMGVSVMEPTGSIVAPGVVYAGVNQYVYGMPFFSVASAGWFKLFGVSVFSMRAESMLWGLILLGAWFAILWRLSGSPGLAVLGVGLVGVNHIVIDAASDGRPDMACAALGTAAIAAYLLLRENDLRWAVFASHGLLALSAACHPNALNYLVGVLLITLYMDWKRLRIPYLLFAAAGYLIVFIPWGVYVASDFATASKQLSMGANNRFNTIFTPLAAIRSEIVDRYLDPVYFSSYSTGAARVKSAVPFFYLLGIGGALFTPRIRRNFGYRLLLLITATGFLILAIVVGQKTYYYLIHIVPLYAALLAVWLYETAGRGVPRIVSAIVLGSYLLLQIGWSAYNIRRDPYHREFLPTAQLLKEKSGGRELVMGPPELGFALGFFNNLIDDGAIGYYTGKRPAWIVMDERGYVQAFTNYPKKAPHLYTYVSGLLENDFVLVHRDRLYRVYGKKP